MPKSADDRDASRQPLRPLGMRALHRYPPPSRRRRVAFTRVRDRRVDVPLLARYKRALLSCSHSRRASYRSSSVATPEEEFWRKGYDRPVDWRTVR